MRPPDRSLPEARLMALARAFPYPPTPDLTARVARGLADREAPPRSQRGGQLSRRAWLALAVGLVLLALALAATPPVQALFQTVFHLGTITVTRVTPTPGPAPDATPPPSTATPLSGLPATASPTAAAVATWAPGLVGETMLSDAHSRVGFAVRLPAYPPDLGPPDRVFVQSELHTALILAWLVPGHPDRPRLLLEMLPQDVYGEKTTQMSTVIQQTTVHGLPALWVDGPSIWIYYDRPGHHSPEPGRLVAGPVLIWHEGDLTYRLESDLSLAEAVRIAESLR